MTPSTTSKPKSPITIKGNAVTIDGVATKKAFGTDDKAFIHGFVSQLVNIGSQGKELDEKGFAFVGSIVTGIEPRDQVEAMLAAQMAAVHNASMTLARRLAHCETIPQQDAAERAFNKLTRTFAMQMDALKRYRVGGHQKMTVEHVHVHDGGQAIVGNVSHGGRGDGKK